MLKRDSSQSSFTSFATFMGDTFLEVMTHLTRNNLFDSAENCAAIVLIDKTCLYADVRRGGQEDDDGEIYANREGDFD